ncbi:hypothetical protein [Leuconostoc citreum]|uniref:hypothetical protein n=1 Tax=Leuconostoc citreum TaxID=33964 RepID=UPI0010E7FD7D|nr:hypothetical protein [Leuconostoc citreum]TDG65324.1 hypothetical protein C5L21_000527 [Leuconostoc citreum]GDZ85338.1 hypothetical protein LCTS_05370 [Leuconostoc citreum]
MKKITVYILMLSLILMFVSLGSWILNYPTFAIMASNLGLLILVISYIWENRKNLIQE